MRSPKAAKTTIQKPANQPNPAPNGDSKPEDPRVVDLRNTARILKNICSIIDGFEIKGVQTAQAILEAAKFVDGLVSQTNAELQKVFEETKHGETQATA